VKKAGIIFGVGHGALMPPAQRMAHSPKILNEKMCQCCGIRPILMP
jgi:hypothetical protein